MKTNQPMKFIDPSKIDKSDDPIKGFCEELIVVAGLDKLPEDFKETYLARLEEEVLKRVGIVILTYMGAEGAKELAEKMNNPDEDRAKVFDYLRKHIDDFDTKMANALDEFATSFIASVQKNLEATEE